MLVAVLLPVGRGLLAKVVAIAAVSWYSNAAKPEQISAPLKQRRAVVGVDWGLGLSMGLMLPYFGTTIACLQQLTAMGRSRVG